MEGLYPNRFEFEYVSSEYEAGQDSTLRAGLAHTDLSGKYDRDHPVICFVARDEEGHRFRVMSPEDIHHMINGLRETRDTLNNCSLCFNAISNYKGSISDFDIMVQMRAFDNGLEDDFELSARSVKNCEVCHVALTNALQDVMEGASEVLVARSV